MKRDDPVGKTVRKQSAPQRATQESDARIAAALARLPEYKVAGRFTGRAVTAVRSAPADSSPNRTVRQATTLLDTGGIISRPLRLASLEFVFAKSTPAAEK